MATIPQILGRQLHCLPTGCWARTPPLSIFLPLVTAVSQQEVCSSFPEGTLDM